MLIIEVLNSSKKGNDMDINDIKKIIEEFERGTTLIESAKRRKISISDIRRSLFELGGEKGKQVLIQELEMISKAPIMKIVNDYKQNKDASQICSDYNIYAGKLSDIIHKYEYITGEKINVNKSHSPQFRHDLDREEIVNRYRSGEHITRIAEDNEVFPSTIRYIITRYEIENGNDIEDEHKQNVEKNKQNSEKQREIAPGLKKTSINSIYNIIKKYNYSFEQLVVESKKRGYKVSEETYIKALEKIENERKKGEER